MTAGSHPVFQQLGDRVGVVLGGTNVGIIRIDSKRVMLIDTGLNDTTAQGASRGPR